MRRNFSLIPALVSAALFTACRPPHVARPLDRDLGTYAFSASTSKREVKGLLHVLPDTIVVESAQGPCRSPHQPNELRLVRYECVIPEFESFTVTVPRSNPVNRSSWNATWLVQRTRSRCTAWSTDASGRTVCASIDAEYYDDRTRQNGALRLERSVTAPPR